MILLNYSKLNGAEFIPHLDMLKHLTRILRRMNVKVNYSQGFNPHALIFMSSPIALGLKSESEYCLIDTDENVIGFKQKFNACAPKGIRCINVYEATKKVSIAAHITSATYEITGLNKFDVNEVLKSDTFVITDKNSKQKEVRDKIISLSYNGDTLVATLKFGNDTLRPDYLVAKLKSIYGGERVDVIKKSVQFKENLDVLSYLEQIKCQ